MTASTRSLSAATVTRYAIGSLGTGGFSTLPGLVLVFYLTDTLGIAAIWAGLLVTFAKVWDVIIDPVIGARSDRALALHGSRRTLMIIGAVSLPVFFALTFAAPSTLGPVVAGIWVMLAFLATATAFSFFQVPYIALPAEIAPDYDSRTRLLSWRVVVLTFAILLFGAGGPMLRGLGGENEYFGYLLMAVVAGVVIGVGMLVSSSVAPRLPMDTPLASMRADAVARVPFAVQVRTNYRAGITALRRSQPFRALLATFMLQGLATGLMLAAANYVAVWVLHSDLALTLLFVALIAPALLCAPLWGLIADRIGKERGFFLASILFGVATATMVIMLWAPGEWIYLPVALAGAGYAGMQALPMAMLPDVIRHDAGSTVGEAGTFSGVWTAGETTGMALGATVLTVTLALTGYVESVGGQQVEQSSLAVSGIILAFSVVPAVLIGLSLLTLARYRLRKSDIDQNPVGAPEKGGSRVSVFEMEPEEILARLERLRAGDAPTHGGHVLSYVYDAGVAELDELAAAAVRAVQPVNGLDPTTFTSVAVMERELIGFARRILHGESTPGEPVDSDNVVVGTVTSGGTESCLLAVKTARDAWRAAGGFGEPRLVAPVTAHAAFQKAAHYFGLELMLVPVDPDSGAVSAAALIEAFCPRTALAVVSAPSYPFAGIDPIAEVAEAASERGIFCHVDACIGGLALPWWPGELPEWDFRVAGVTSISADLHKFGYAPKGASVLLQRGRDLGRQQYFATTQWPGYPVVNPTMLGSKSAGALAAAWAIVQALGDSGFARLTAQAARATGAVRTAISAIEGLRVLGDPVGPLLAVATDTTVSAERRVDPHHWADRVRGHGFVLQLQPGFAQADGTRLPATTHLTITPVTEARLPELLPALAEAADEVRGVPGVDAGAVLAAVGGAQALGSGDSPLDSDAAWQILQGIGLAPGEGEAKLPESLAPFLALVEALPAPLTERLLIELLARIIEPTAESV